MVLSSCAVAAGRRSSVAARYQSVGDHAGWVPGNPAPGTFVVLDANPQPGRAAVRAIAADRAPVAA